MTETFGSLGISAIRSGLAAKEFSAREVAEGTLARIAAADAQIHAFLETTEELALAAADKVDAAIAAGTFADSLVLRTLNEDSANCAYELTFLAAAVICFIYVVTIKKDKLVFKAEAPKYAGALFETAGQFAYIYALADEAHVALSAPIISAYCVASVLWSRIFLKEKLSWKHYAMIALVVIGIVMIGVFDI